MPAGNVVILSCIVLAFVSFMGVLAFTAWWSERGPKTAASEAGASRSEHRFDKAA
jgi:hypothetical protein